MFKDCYPYYCNNSETILTRILIYMYMHLNEKSSAYQFTIKGLV